MIVEKWFFAAQTLSALATLVCSIVIAVFQIKWLRKASLFSIFAIMVSGADFLISIWMTLGIKKSHRKRIRVPLACSISTLILATFSVISWESFVRDKGCIDSSQDPHAFLGPTYQHDLLHNWCGLKRVGGILFFVSLGIWAISTGIAFYFKSQSGRNQPQKTEHNVRYSSLNTSPSFSNYGASGDAWLIKLQPSSWAYGRVLQLFQEGWRHADRARPTVVSIYQISSETVRARYNLYLAGLQLNHEVERWHGTGRQCKLGDDDNNLHPCNRTQCKLCQIITTGYRVDLAASGRMFGYGIYSSEASSKSAHYCINVAHPNNNYKALLLNTVAVGREYNITAANHNLRAPPQGFDSVHASPGTSRLLYQETVVYHDNAVLPTFLLMLSN